MFNYADKDSSKFCWFIRIVTICLDLTRSFTYYCDKTSFASPFEILAISQNFCYVILTADVLSSNSNGDIKKYIYIFGNPQRSKGIIIKATYTDFNILILI